MAVGIALTVVLADDSLTPWERAEHGRDMRTGALSERELPWGLQAVGLVEVEIVRTQAVTDRIASAGVRAHTPSSGEQVTVAV